MFLIIILYILQFQECYGRGRSGGRNDRNQHLTRKERIESYNQKQSKLSFGENIAKFLGLTPKKREDDIISLLSLKNTSAMVNSSNDNLKDFHYSDFSNINDSHSSKVNITLNTNNISVAFSVSPTIRPTLNRHNGGRTGSRSRRDGRSNARDKKSENNTRRRPGARRDSTTNVQNIENADNYSTDTLTGFINLNSSSNLILNNTNALDLLANNSMTISAPIIPDIPKSVNIPKSRESKNFKRNNNKKDKQDKEFRNNVIDKSDNKNSDNKSGRNRRDREKNKEKDKDYKNKEKESKDDFTTSKTISNNNSSYVYHHRLVKKSNYNSSESQERVEKKILCKDFICQDKSPDTVIETYPIYKTMSTRNKEEKIKSKRNVYCQPYNHNPTFISFFDWVLIRFKLSSFIQHWKSNDDHINCLYGNMKIPKTIYIDSSLLPFFIKEILPNINTSIIIASGNNDFTIPINIDTRYNSTEYDLKFKKTWKILTNHSLITHWLVENHMENHPKVSTLPIGFNPKEFHPDDRSDFPSENSILPLSKRPLKMLSNSRIREGSQWIDRNLAHNHCLLYNNSCVPNTESTTHKDFISLVATYPFLLCVHGGGIDPSPKAWEAITVGTIPIIEHSPLDDAYSQLPVAFVANITEFITWSNISEELTSWIKKLGKYYEINSYLRNQTLEKLTAKYWFKELVTNKFQNSSFY